MLTISKENVIFWRIAFALFLITLLYLTLLPQPPKPIDVRNIDKLYHLVAFALMSFIFKVAFNKIESSSVVLFSSLLGVGIEVTQYFIPGRGFSVADMVADCVGVLIGLFIALCFIKQVSHSIQSRNT